MINGLSLGTFDPFIRPAPDIPDIMDDMRSNLQIPVGIVRYRIYWFIR